MRLLGFREGAFFEGFLQPQKHCASKSMDNLIKVNFIFQILDTIMKISNTCHFFLCMLLICGSHSKKDDK
jgi:hypothetical protein